MEWTDAWSLMHGQHRRITADAGKLSLAGTPPPLAGGLAIRAERRADVLVLWLSGALDRATSALLDREFDDRAGQAARLVVDLTELEFIDSSGLDTLVRTHRRARERDQRLRFRHGPHVGQSPLELTREVQLRSRRVSRRTSASSDENRFAHVVTCADVDHQRPLVIDAGAPWTSPPAG